jgi:HEAT repeat protein
VLGRALHDGDEPTRHAAADAMGGLGEPEAARSLYPLLRDPSHVLRNAAFAALAQIAAATGKRMAAPTV